MSLLSLLSLGFVLAQPATIPVRQPAEEPASRVQLLTIDASSKTDFVFLNLEKGELVASTEEGPWIFGVRRYIFKTPTGSNGTSVGGSYGGVGSEYAAFTSCEKITFSPDEIITMLGYTISANLLITSEWYDYDESGAVAPLDKFFVIARDNDCVKVKIHSYATGIYGLEYRDLTPAAAAVPENRPEVIEPVAE